jgi:hypothetical protein
MLFRKDRTKEIEKKLLGILVGRDLPFELDSKISSLSISDVGWWTISLKVPEEKFTISKTKFHQISLCFIYYKDSNKLDIKVLIEEDAYYPFKESYKQLLENLQKDFKVQFIPLFIYLKNGNFKKFYIHELEKIESIILEKQSIEVITSDRKDLKSIEKILSKCYNFTKDIDGNYLILSERGISEKRFNTLQNIFQTYEFNSKEFKRKIEENYFEITEIY